MLKLFDLLPYWGGWERLPLSFSEALLRAGDGRGFLFFLFFYYLCTQFSKFVYMIITIARQCGCGAVHVGEILAEHYGIPFYTRQNLLKMAEEKGFLPELADFFEERPRG